MSVPKTLAIYQLDESTQMRYNRSWFRFYRSFHKKEETPMSDSTTYWFLEPLDAHTNEVLSRVLDEDNAWRHVVASDGGRHDVWLCDFAVAQASWRSRFTLHLKLKIFNRVGRHGQARDVTGMAPKFFGQHRRRARVATAAELLCPA